MIIRVKRNRQNDGHEGYRARTFQVGIADRIFPGERPVTTLLCQVQKHEYNEHHGRVLSPANLTSIWTH